MADVKQIEVNGVTYDIHDATARSQIANLQESVSDYLIMKYVSLSNTGSVAAGASFTNDYDMTTNIPTGYKMIAVTPTYSGDDSFAWVQTLIKEGNTIRIQIVNTASHADSGNPSVYLVCIKNI